VDKITSRAALLRIKYPFCQYCCLSYPFLFHHYIFDHLFLLIFVFLHSVLYVFIMWDKMFYVMQVVEVTRSGSWALWMYMTLAQVYKAIITGLCFTSVFICISNSAPNAKKVSVHCVTTGGHLCILFVWLCAACP